MTPATPREPQPKGGRRSPLISAALLGCALFAALGLSLFWDLGGDPELRRFVLVELRLPRALLGFVVGSTLGLVGAALQTLFQNPLASPTTIGTTAGAALGALLALVLGAQGAWLLPASTLFAFVGALVATSVVFAVASSGRARLEEILLAGIAVGLATGALSQALHALADAPALFASAQWSLGQLPQVGFDRLLLSLAPSALCAAVILGRARALGALGLGEDWARSFGVDTLRVRKEILVASSLGVGAVVALAGPIAFVGLLVPHLVRRLFAPSPRALLGWSWWSGGVYLLACDTLARELLPHRELPVGVLTALLGAPLLFFLVLRRERSD